MPEQRNRTNFLRVLAIALVVNSHMDSLYPRQLAPLATGGMIGNSLFFLLSAWGLLLSIRERPREFREWYSRRIGRIYPSVWVTVILLTFPLGLHNGSIRLGNILDEMSRFFFPPFWFLQALMIYYVGIFFIIRNFCLRRLALVTGPVVIVYVIYYLFLLDLTKFSIEGTPFRLIFYFLVMLSGLWLGSQHDTIKFRGLVDLVGLFLSIACIYGHKYLMQRGMLLSWQFVQHLAVFPMLYFFARVASSDLITRTIMDSRYLGRFLTFLSTMTLEIFMVNNSIDALDLEVGGFPLNVVALLTLNFVLALVIFSGGRVLTRALDSSRELDRAQKVLVTDEQKTPV